METDPLQQLRDVHLPSDPSWWPPAIGWWVLAVALIAAAVWAVRVAHRWWRAGAPARQARALHQDLFRAWQAGNVDAATYTAQTNEILKRLLVVAQKRPDLAGLSGQAWLIALDTIDGSHQFTDGPGRDLGDKRFRPDAAFDPAALSPLIEHLLKAARFPAPARLNNADESSYTEWSAKRGEA